MSLLARLSAPTDGGPVRAKSANRASPYVRTYIPRDNPPLNEIYITILQTPDFCPALPGPNTSAIVNS